MQRFNIVKKWTQLHPESKKDIGNILILISATGGTLGGIVGVAAGVTHSIRDIMMERHNAPGSSMRENMIYSFNILSYPFKYMVVGAIVGATAPISIPAMMIYEKYSEEKCED